MSDFTNKLVSLCAFEADCHKREKELIGQLAALMEQGRTASEVVLLLLDQQGGDIEKTDRYLLAITETLDHLMTRWGFFLQASYCEKKGNLHDKGKKSTADRRKQSDPD